MCKSALFMRCILMLLASSSVYAETIELKLASAYTADNFQTQNIQKFSDDTKNATKGGVDIKVYPAGDLIKPLQIFDGVRAGTTAQAGEVIMSSQAAQDALFQLDSLPFLVNDYEDALRLWQLSRPAIEKSLDERGIVLLYAVPWPPQNLYSDRPINSTEDLKGLKMRSYNATTERFAQMIGATPITIQAVDLNQAIADKKINLMLTSSSTGFDTKAWSGMKYYYKVNAWIPKNIVFMNKAAFTKLNPDHQKKILAAAAEAETRGWKRSKDKDAEFEAQLVSHGMTVSNIDPFIKNKLNRVGVQMVREKLKTTSAESSRVFTQILIDYTVKNSKK